MTTEITKWLINYARSWLCSALLRTKFSHESSGPHWEINVWTGRQVQDMRRQKKSYKVFDECRLKKQKWHEKRKQTKILSLCVRGARILIHTNVRRVQGYFLFSFHAAIRMLFLLIFSFFDCLRKKLELWESSKLQFSYPYFVGLISTPAMARNLFRKSRSDVTGGGFAMRAVDWRGTKQIEKGDERIGREAQHHFGNSPERDSFFY